MTYSYYNFDKLKEINSDTHYQEWLDSYQRPYEKKWVNELIEYFAKRSRTITERKVTRLIQLFNAFPDLAYKLYIIYIQEKDHPNTRSFHNSIGQYALINFLENVENCEAGSNERLNTIIANFFFSENNIKSFIHSFRTNLVELISYQYFKENNIASEMEVHFKAALERTANQYLQFNTYAPPGNAYNTPSERLRNFLNDKLPLFNTPFKLLEFIEGQIQWTPHVAKMQEIRDFESMLKVKLVIENVDEEKLWITDEETYESAINKDYIRQLICQKLCELQVFNKDIIFNNGQYILPKPDIFSEYDFIYWYEHLATEEDKKHLTSQEKNDSFIVDC